MLETIKQDKDRLLRVIAFSSLWGLLAHGMCLFNKYAIHDDATYFNGIGRTYSSGRWMLGLMGEISLRFNGSRHYSVSVVKGAITLLCVAMIFYLVFSMMEINDTAMIIVVSGLFVAFPAITGVFGYMFTAPYYYSAALLGMIGVYIWYRKRNILSGIICILLMACATGTYQANLTICACALTLAILHDVYRSEPSWQRYVKDAVSFIVISIGSIVVYSTLSKIFASLNGVDLSGYKGISTMGMCSPGEYVNRILTAYRVFFLAPNGLGNMFLYSSRYFHLALIIVCMILAAVMLVKVFQKSVLKGCAMTFILVIFPVMADLIYVMCGWDEVHALMTFAEVFVFVLAAWLWKNTNTNGRAVSVLRKSVVCLCAVLLFMLIRFDNICYTKAEILQNETLSYFTVLETKITDVPEYTRETPVVYIGEYDKAKTGYANVNDMFDPITVYPYYMNNLVNDLKWKKIMAIWCGFDPRLGSPEEFQDLEEVKAMPRYPQPGSIKYINGSIVVKFSK